LSTEDQQERGGNSTASAVPNMQLEVSQTLVVFFFFFFNLISIGTIWISGFRLANERECIFLPLGKKTF
jgi:nitroreductase